MPSKFYFCINLDITWGIKRCPSNTGPITKSYKCSTQITRSSALALEIWENTNKKNEIKEETAELQILVEIELNSIIKLASTAKAESSTLHNKVRELQTKVAFLEEELKEKSKQCENLQQQVDELNFKDIGAEMISDPKRQNLKRMTKIHKTFEFRQSNCGITLCLI